MPTDRRCRDRSRIAFRRRRVWRRGSRPACRRLSRASCRGSRLRQIAAGRPAAAAATDAARRAVRRSAAGCGFGERSAELDAGLAVGHHDRAVLFGELDGDVAAGRGLAGDLPIPAGLGEIAVGQVRVPHALLMVAIEPVVGVAGRCFVVLASRPSGSVVSVSRAPRRAAVAGLRLVARVGFLRLVRLFGLRFFAGLAVLSRPRTVGIWRLVLRLQQRFELAFAMHAGQPHA